MRLVDLEEKMKEKGLRNIDIAREHSVSEKAVSEWKRGKKYPRDEALSYLLGKFDVLKAETDDGDVVVLRKNANPLPSPAPKRGKGKKSAA